MVTFPFLKQVDSICFLNYSVFVQQIDLVTVSTAEDILFVK